MGIIVNLFILMAALTSFKANAQDNYHCGDLETGYKLGFQSPIELISSESFKCAEETSFEFHNYNRSFQAPAVMTNNGYTVNIKLPALNHASISGGPLMHEEYIPVSIHPHWGQEDSCGTEHVIDSFCFSMELHIVHIRSDCKSFAEAISLGKVAVVGILLQKDSSLTTEHEGFAQISNALRFIPDFNSSTEIYNLTLSKLIGSHNCKSYFNYPGSLTTPPYSEGVNWIVCAEAVKISPAQYREFLTLRNSRGEPIMDNFRGLQPKTSSRRVCLTHTNGRCGVDGRK